ncbi:Ubr3 ubiquitin ligase [Carabus blaptoides fortunei]
MASNSIAAHVLMKKGKRGAAAYIHADCSGAASPHHLNELLDLLLNPRKAIDEWETIDWCKWLMAGGRTPDEFSTIVRTYDNATTCGLVWTPNFVAYRCRTCGISPCMSLCTECFKKGNHYRHDFNMFLSQAGGACDCGDTSVMKETGFCDRHGPNKSVNKSAAPLDLMCVAEAMMPRIILRLIQHLRENSNPGTPDAYLGAILDADAFITMLLDFNNMGALMRHVMTSALTNPQMYRLLTAVSTAADSEYTNYMTDSKRIYEEAIRSLPNPEPPDEYKDCPSLQEQLIHRTFLEELVFWTVKFEFPQKVVCLLLNMLPDPDYKDALTQAFVLHYSRISMMLEQSSDPDKLSNRVVHVSVQLFSNESLALRMADHLNLLHVMVVSLKYMMSKILIQNTLHDQDKNFHYVVNCAERVMKDHCYWPLVSDLNNVLSHRPVAVKFMSDDSLLEMWFAFLSMFQGMNVNQREMNQHVEFEPNTYYAAFSAELEASAYPMWALVSHLVDANSMALTKRVLSSCLSALLEWLDAVYFTNPNISDSLQVSFHLPLHRYLSVFMCQAIKLQGVKLREVLPPADVVHLIMMHPLRVQVAFYEILNGLWVRNGLQIKGQAMTYIQCNFCNSMVDADIYLLQVCCTRIPADSFLNVLIDKFHVKEWMSLAPYQAPQNTYLDGEHDTPMLESFLTFLATLISVRTNLGLSDTALNRLEMVTLLCMGDKTHSQLMELMPERCGTSQNRDFETLLAEVADYRAPNLEASGNMQQGMYAPKASVWEHQYDPVHVLLRAVHRRDFQTSLDRYTEYGTTPWPPFRPPAPCSEAYEDPRKLLRSRVFHAVALVVLYKAVNGHVSEHVMALVIYLLEMAVVSAEPSDEETCRMCSYPSSSQRVINDMDLQGWFQTDCLSDNLRTVVNKVILTPEPEVSPITYSSDSDIEWDASEAENEMSDMSADGPSNVLMLEESDGSGWTSTDVATTQSIMLLGGQGAGTTTAGGSGSNLSRLVLHQAHIVPGTLALPSSETSMAVALPEDMHMSSSSDVATVGQPALPPPIQHPAVLMGNEVGRNPSIYRNTTGGPPMTLSTYTTTTEIVPSTSGARKPFHVKRRQVQNSSSNPPTVKVNESIISLLLKLHSQLSGVPDSYNVDDLDTTSTEPTADSVIGDGPFFVAKLLRKITALDITCRDAIHEAKQRLWPPQQESEREQKQRENKEREERRRRAKERQQKLMAEFASKQKEFLASAMAREQEEASTGMDWTSSTASETAQEPAAVMRNKQEYDCVICNQTTASTEDKPMGLVVLVQASSVLGHRRRYGQSERAVLPTSEGERYTLRRDDIQASEFDRRTEEFDRHFDNHSWLLSVNLGWEGGVHVQTCGHHLHLDCLKSYLESLRTQQRQQSLAVDRGEYFCPLCRQLANSVVPLSPQLRECTAVVRSRPGTMSAILSELSNFLKENQRTPSNSNLAEAMRKAMEDMTNSTTHLNLRQQAQTGPPSHQSLFLFVTSIARTNLEVELVQRGGSLVTINNPTCPPLTPKLPLLHVLAVHARFLAQWPFWSTWQQLSGVVDSPSTAPMALQPIEREVPLLYRDPAALLMQFTLLLPLHIDQTYFACVVKVLYNLLYYQVVTQLSCSMSSAERAQVLDRLSRYHLQQQQHQFNHHGGDRVATLAGALSLVVDTLSHSDLYIEDDTASAASTSSSTTPSHQHQQQQQHVNHSVALNMNALEQQVQKLCLPFLRIAALLRHHLYQQPLPEVRSAEYEFVRLVYFLELVTEGMDWDCFNAAVALNWPQDTSTALTTPRLWCDQLCAFAGRSQIAARNFLVDQHVLWHPPRLLSLPREYEKIFTYYHERQCSQCQSIPQETSICLLCGTVVCLKQVCCKQQNVCEAVQHSIECGGGTGIYLVVTSTYIIVIRGRRACLWGSLYLDDFEEEDRDLKRGKPLYLSQDRFQLLEQQWLAHRFDHTKKTWVWHRDAL